MRRLAILLLLIGCEKPAAAGADRIVSIVPSATELLFAVGAGDQIVGVTTWCDWPPEAKAKPKVGHITLDMERLTALNPDLIVASSIAPAVAELKSKGYNVLIVDPANFEEIARSLVLLGKVTGHAAEGAKAAEALIARVAAVKAAPGPTVYLESSADPIWTAGSESYAGDAIRRAGGRNIFEGGWKQIEWESVVARDPEVILLTHDRREGLERRAGWKDLKAVKRGRVHFVAKEHYIYPTPRLVEGLEEAARLFHAKNP